MPHVLFFNMTVSSPVTTVVLCSRCCISINVQELLSWQLKTLALADEKHGCIRFKINQTNISLSDLH